jgi:creatinine amidohydrolase
MRLKEMKAPSLKSKYDFLLPIGSIEQHGPFIPFGTDTYITEYLVDKVEKKFPKIIILPVLEYSRSQEHRGFAGTVWLREGTLENVLCDICNSLKTVTNRIFIISFHENSRVINRFIEKYSSEFGDIKIINLAIFDKEDNIKIERLLKGPEDIHAGNTEISDMLIVNKKLVRIPKRSYPKQKIDGPFDSDDLYEKSKDGIADNHPKWVVSNDIGQKVLKIYENRIIKNLSERMKKC